MHIFVSDFLEFKTSKIYDFALDLFPECSTSHIIKK